MSQTKAQLIEGLNINTSAPADALVIDSSGRVGIGDSSPSNKLVVKDGGSPTIEINGQGRAASLTLGVTASESKLFEGSNNALAFGTNNTERMRIDSSGNVGIGTTSPGSNLDIEEDGASANAELAINYAGSGSGRTSAIRFQRGGSNFAYIAGATFALTSGNNDDLAIAPVSGKNLLFGIGNSEKARIDSSGNVGIGTSAPSAPLTVFGGSASSPTIRIEGGSSGNDNARIESEYNLVLACNGDGDLSDRKIQFRNNATDLVTIDSSGRLLVGTSSATLDSSQALLQVSHSSGPLFVLGRDDTTVSSGNLIGDIKWYSNAGSANEEVARIRVDADGDQGSGDKPGRIEFHTTADGASSPTERMRIDSSGNVGIGTTSPSSLLHLESASSPKLLLVDTTNSCTLKAYAQNSNAHLGTESNHDFIFDTNNTERLRIDSSGRLLISLSSSLLSYAGLQIKGDADTGGHICLAHKTTAPVSGNNIGSVRCTNSAGGIGAIIGIEADANWTAGSSFPSRIIFATTASGASSPSERMRIDSSGRLLVGQTSVYSPTNGGQVPCVINDAGDHRTALVVNNQTNGSSAGSAVILAAHGQDWQLEATSVLKGNRDFTIKAGTNERLRLDNSGRFLYGTSTGVNLNNASGGSAREAKAYIYNTASVTSERYNLGLITGNNGVAGPTVFLSKTRASSNTHTVVQSGDETGDIRFSGSDGTFFIESARIRAKVDGTPGSQDMPGRLEFHTTADGASSTTERVRIDSSGNFQLRSGHQLKCLDADNHTSAQIGNIDNASNSARISIDPDSTGSGSYLEVRVDNAEVYRAVNNFVRLSSQCNGLQFNGDTSTANALDDYEEGTWTPVPNFGGGTTGITYATAPTGNYTKIGNLVFVVMGFQFSNKGSSTGSFVVSGLPYSVASTGSFKHPNSVVNAHNMTNNNKIYAALGAGSAINYRRISDSNTDAVPGDGDFQNNSGFYHSMVYVT